MKFFWLTLLSGLLDSFSVLTVIPLINVILQASSINLGFFNIDASSTPEFYYIFLFFSLILVISLSTFIKISIIRKSLNASAHISHYLACVAHKKILLLSYEDLIIQPKADLLATLSSKLSLTSFFITFFLQSLSYAVIALMLTITMSLLQPLPVIIAGFVLIPSYWFFMRLTKSRISRNSLLLSQSLSEQMEKLKLAFEFTLEMKLYDAEWKSIESLNQTNKTLRFLDAENSFFASFPKYAVEAIGYLLLAGIAMSDAYLGKSPDKIFSMLSVLAIGTSKLLPYLQQIFNSLSLARANAEPASDVLGLVK